MPGKKGKTIPATWWHAEKPVQRGNASHSPGALRLADLANMTDTEAAGVLHVARSTVQRWRHEAGVTKKQGGRPPALCLLVNDATRQILRCFVERRLSLAQIAEITGLRESAVKRLFTRCAIRPYKGWRGLRR